MELNQFYYNFLIYHRFGTMNDKVSGFDDLNVHSS